MGVGVLPEASNTHHYSHVHTPQQPMPCIHGGSSEMVYTPTLPTGVPLSKGRGVVVGGGAVGPWS